MELGERLVRGFLKNMLLEGGKSFSDVSPVTLEALNATWDRLRDDLTAMGVADIRPIGTTFKKPIMGDVDLAVKFPLGKDELMILASELLGPENVKKSGADVLSVRYPIYDKQGRETGDFMQVDLMIGNPDYITWARFGPSPVKGSIDYSPVKGLVRNILFAVINRYAAERIFPGKSTELDRVKYAVDFDKVLKALNVKEKYQFNTKYVDIGAKQVRGCSLKRFRDTCTPGAWIVMISGHYAAIVDNVIVDNNFLSGKARIIYAWRVS
jgi:hypothetical protein